MQTQVVRLDKGREGRPTAKEGEETGESQRRKCGGRERGVEESLRLFSKETRELQKCSGYIHYSRTERIVVGQGPME